MTANGRDALFLGLDSSTQTLKGLLIDSQLNVIHETAIHFDRDLPEFKTEGGVHRHPDGLTVTSPPLMWVAALDLLLAKLKQDGCALDRVAAISGSGQQHGSVWLRAGARGVLQGLDGDRPLRVQLADLFSVAASPVWMDSSTAAQCRALEAALGGPQAVADLTGSRAYERFTGNQIARIRQLNPQGYADTERIALVSSFVASLLIGDYAPIDTADGAGMNLMDLRQKRWAPAALKATAPGLARRLGRIVAGHKVVGSVHAHYVQRYGFAADCAVVAFSGDNPCSLAGLRLQNPGEIAISLGTSDTVFGSLAEPRPSASEGHIFANPVDPAGYMALICYKNGSLTREFVRDTFANRSWDTFRALVAEAPVGNEGRLAFFVREPEITPPIFKTGTWRFDGAGRPVPAFTPAQDARAVLEAQFLSMRLHGGHVGLKPASILATGGASVDPAVLRVMCDVFGVPVLTCSRPGSAALGAAYRALHGWTCRRRRRFVPFAEVMAAAPAPSVTVTPDPAAHSVYTSMLPRFAELEQHVVAGG